ncbi:MAG: YwbE family protein [Anaerolineaceae bacterium]|nr:YwbE family protein [Anaerolineaceae bacterium]MBN2678092.1 YwbE family protein [Anaerolineaceae bacterium]
MAPPKCAELQPGIRVRIVEKQNQPTGQLTEGVVMRILTSSPVHPHGIKVMLADGKVGRVQEIVR